jgi:hypothetical protein
MADHVEALAVFLTGMVGHGHRAARREPGVTAGSARP